MHLVREGVLTFPLFHGTSNLFIDSICQNGFGAKDPIKECRVIPFLQRLCEECESTVPTDPTWLSMKWLVEQMAGQKNSMFRHGLAFLSPSQITAVRYAASNSFGSEAISTCATLYQLLAESGGEHVLDSDLAMLPIIELLRKPGNPVLVEVFGARVTDLQGERGQDAQEVIDALEGLVSSLGMELFQVVSQQHNFSLVKPIEASRLRLYDITVTYDRLGFPQYHLEPLTCQERL